MSSAPSTQTESSLIGAVGPVRRHNHRDNLSPGACLVICSEVACVASYLVAGSLSIAVSSLYFENNNDGSLKDDNVGASKIPW